VNIPAPYAVQTASLQDSAKIIYDAPDVITREEYYSYQDRLIAVRPVEAVFYDRGNTQANPQVGTLFLYPIPDGNATYTLVLQCNVPFTQFPNLTSQFSFPDYYQEAFWSNLAIRVAGGIGGKLKQEIPKIARDSYTNLIRKNAKRVVSGVDLPKTKPYSGQYNIYTDQGA